MFQFYLSSIKSGSVQGGSSFSSEFQFYLSSIKRRLELVVIRLLRSFNSTLVQLKVIEGINKNNTSAGFNSTLVQLKAYQPSVGSNVYTCFNSTLVQLKESVECRAGSH